MDSSHYNLQSLVTPNSSYDILYFRSIYLSSKKGAIMELGQIIAFNLKELRMERNLSLGQLSRESGISKAMLSDIEKGGSNPTINTIWKIANGLKVPYTKLIDPMHKEAAVIRRSGTAMQTGESPSYRVHCYYETTPVRNFELFYVELDACSSNCSIGHSEKAQEYIYIIRGELVLHMEKEDFTLGEGDSLMFDSSISHTYINRQDTLLTFMVINYYPD